MKRKFSTPYRLAILALIIAFFLSACERPIPREEPAEGTDVVPTVDIIIPTSTPLDLATAEPPPAEDASAIENPDDAQPPAEETAPDAPAESPDETAGEPAEQTEPAATETTHIVQAGENLFRIGLRYGFTFDELARYNNIANPHRIYVGQVIRIPPK